MHLVITHDHSAAVDLISQRMKQHFGKTTDPTGHTLKNFLSSIPVINKTDLISYGQKYTSLMHQEAILFSETSGTTSSPLQTPRNKHDLNWNVLNQINAYKPLVQAGVDRVCVLHPSVLSPFIEGSVRALHELGVGHVRLYPIPKVCDYKRIYEVIDRYRITTIMSTPSLVYKTLYELAQIGSGKLPSSLRKLLLTGERFSQENRSNMRRILGIDGIITPFVYGSSETATIMVGQSDCSYRPITEDFVFEIIDEEQTDNLTVKGNLLVTWLRGGMLPIVRYDTGDFFTAHHSGRDNSYKFIFEGRNGNEGISLHQQNIIEHIIYTLPEPVFHFDCNINPESKKIALSLVLNEKSKINSRKISDQLAKSIGDNWEFETYINPEHHSFFDFSPSPKTRKFYRA